MSHSPRYNTTRIYGRMLQEARPFWGHVAAVFGLNLLSTPLKLLIPVPVMIALNNVYAEESLPPALANFLGSWGEPGSTTLLWLASALLVVASFLAYLNGLGIWLLHTYTAEKLLLAFRSKLLRHLQELPLTYHDTKGTTDSTYRIQHDAPAIQWIVLDGVQPLVTSAVTLVVMWWAIALLDWQIALIAIVLAPLLMLISQSWSRRLRRQWSSAKQMQSTAMSVVQESLGGLRVVKAFGNEDRERSRFATHATAGMRGQLDVAMSQGLFDLLTGTAIGLGSATALYIGVRHIQQGVIDIGQFWLIWAYLAQLFGPLEMIGKKLSTLQGAFASGERALTVLDEMPHVVEKPDAKSIDRVKGRFLFDQVTFAYEDSPPVLESVSMEIEPGTCVGIVGPTGTGKTTFAALSMRFYDPTRGRILLDGVDLRDYRLGDLRCQYSVVLQEPVLFSTSIAENIAYGRPSATMEEIEAAAEAANAHLFVKKLEEGYLTQVGEGGMKLSGGERQRISLARAFLRDAPLLILDEPTSAVDMETEGLIAEALGRLTQGRTTFLITHRTGLLSLCDTIIRVRQGRAVLEPASRGPTAPTAVPSNSVG